MRELRETDGLSMAESKFETKALILSEVAFHPARCPREAWVSLFWVGIGGM